MPKAPFTVKSENTKKAHFLDEDEDDDSDIDIKPGN